MLINCRLAKVFSVELLEKSLKKHGLEHTTDGLKSIHTWGMECDGMEVIGGKVAGYSIADSWCYFELQFEEE